MSLNNPLISIIIPVYNTSKYLTRCLESIIKQTYQNIEIICIDDGSTDNSFKIIKKYATKDPRIKALSQANSGQSSARNKGIKKATGKYICFIDSDDEIAPTYIEQLLNSLDNNKVLSVCGITFKKLKKNTITHAYINRLRQRHKKESFKAYILYLLAIDGRMYSSVNKMFHTKIVKTCYFDEEINFAEDTKFVLDYLKKTKGEISFVLEPLYTYNFGTETSTIVQSSTKWSNWEQSYSNLKKWVGKKPTIQEKFWLKAIYIRWRISFCRSKKRSR